ncbi:MAG: GAF domain-containing protein [Chloroflexi bacterium]|nr:GAF domain-containing protein [Chloroflexota bacterium]
MNQLNLSSVSQFDNKYTSPHALVGVFVAGTDGVVARAHGDIQALLGCSPAGVQDTLLLDYVAEHARLSARESWCAYIEGPAREAFTFATIARGCRGDMFPVQVELSRLGDQDSILIIARAVSSHYQEQIIALERITQVMQTSDIQEALATVLAEFTRSIACDRAHILVLLEERLYYAEVDQEGQYRPAEAIDLEAVKALPFHKAVQHAEQYLIFRHYLPTPPRTADAAMCKSWLGLPLRYQDASVGTIVLEYSASDAFPVDDVAMALRLSRASAAALWSVCNELGALQQTSRLKAMNNVALAVRHLDSAGVMEVVHREISNLMDTRFFYIGLYKPEQKQLLMQHVYDNDERIEDQVIPADSTSSISGWVIHNRQSLIIKDFATDPLPSSVIYHGAAVRSAVYIPLIAQEEIVGLLSVQSDRPHHFSEADILLLETVAGPTAVAIRNVQLFNDIQRRLHQSQALHELANAITSSRDIETIITIVAQRLQVIFGALACAITLREGNHLVLQAGVGLPALLVAELWDPTSAQLQPVMAEGKALYVSDVQEDNRLKPLHPQSQSLILVPLVVKQQVIGALSLESETPGKFTADHEHVLTLVAAQLAGAIENARLLKEAQERAAELETAYAELKETDRLRWELVNNVSHELRSPLSFIRGYVGLMSIEELGSITEEQAEALATINKKTDALLRLINDILEMEKIRPETLQRQEEDIAELLRQSVAGAQLTYRDQPVYFEDEIPDHPVLVVLDALRIEQVLGNLISNAVKFSYPGGTVRIRCEYDDAWVRISVADSGIGIPPEKLSRIFERFYRVAGTAREGIGIGLSIVQQIVDAHSGELNVNSQVGEGSTFSFSLPREGRATPGGL